MFKLLVVDDPHSQHFDKNKEVRRTIFAVDNLVVLGAGTQTCYDCGWVKLLFILLDQNLGLSHCIGYSSHHLSHQLGPVWEWSSLLPDSSAVLVWVLWPPSQVLWGNTGRLHYTALHFLHPDSDDCSLGPSWSLLSPQHLQPCLALPSRLWEAEEDHGCVQGNHISIWHNLVQKTTYFKAKLILFDTPNDQSNQRFW